MSGIILPNGKSAAPVEPELTEEQKADLAAKAASLSEEEVLPKVRTAFAVIVDKNGVVSVDPSLVKGVIADESLTNESIVGALNILLNEISTTMSAMKTAQIMMQQAQAMAQQQQFASIQQRLQTPAGR